MVKEYLVFIIFAVNVIKKKVFCSYRFRMFEVRHDTNVLKHGTFCPQGRDVVLRNLSCEKCGYSFHVTPSPQRHVRQIHE